MKSEHTASLPTAIEPSPTQYDQSTSPPRLPPAHVEIAPVKQADMKDQSVTEEPPAQQSTGPAPRVFIYGYKVKKADVRNAENTMLALSTRFGCKPGKLVEYNSSTEAPATLEGTLKSGTTVWIPGDECTYRGAGTRLHDDLILAYTVTPAEAPLSLNDLALRFGCNARSLRRYVRDENPSINTSAIKANTTVFLPKMYCRGIE